MVRNCRDCGHEVSEQAPACPHCGAPSPAEATWDGYGFGYRSEFRVMGLPLVHISFKYRNFRPVPAVGVIAIGQFACGVVTVAQFGVGLISVSQFTVAGFALAQFALGYSVVAQLGLYLHEGHGQLVMGVMKLLGML